jgi:hypothetical protein
MPGASFLTFPLEPNQTTPNFLTAVSSPAARPPTIEPPGVVRATRLDTTMSKSNSPAPTRKNVESSRDTEITIFRRNSSRDRRLELWQTRATQMPDQSRRRTLTGIFRKRIARFNSPVRSPEFVPSTSS